MLLDLDELISFGLSALESGKFLTAINVYTCIIHASPEISENRVGLAKIYCNRGMAFKRSEKHDKAISNFNKAISLDPLNHTLFINRGSVYLDLNQQETARKDFSIASYLVPNDSEVLIKLGEIELELELLEEALAHFDQAIRVNPEFGRAYFCRGNVNFSLGRDHCSADLFKQAIQDYQKALALKTQQGEYEFYEATAHNFMGLAYSELGLINEAIDAFQKAVNCNAQLNVEYFLNLVVAKSELAYKENNTVLYDVLIKEFDYIIELVPKYAGAYYHRGLIKFDIKEYQAAIADFIMTLKLVPNIGSAHYYLGLCYAVVKDYLKAIVHIKEAIDLEPQEIQYQKTFQSVLVGLSRSGYYPEIIAEFLQQLTSVQTDDISNKENSIPRNRLL